MLLLFNVGLVHDINSPCFVPRHVMNLAKRLSNVNLAPENEKKQPEIHLRRYLDIDSKHLFYHLSRHFKEPTEYI